jgi:hypothetical protein
MHERTASVAGCLQMKASSCRSTFFQRPDDMPIYVWPLLVTSPDVTDSNYAITFALHGIQGRYVCG